MRKTMKTLTATAAALFGMLSLPACAQPVPRAANDADPALWVVRDADTTIYLFGTIHVLKPGLTWFDEGVKKAFDASDTLVLEMIQPDQATMQKIVIAKGMTTGQPPLGERVPANKRAAYLKALADSGVPSAAFDRMQPWLAAVTLSLAPVEKLGYDSANGPETVLTAAAKAAGKAVVGLETAEQQLGFFGSLSPAAQMGFLTSTIDDLPKGAEQMRAMVREWSDGDPAALARDMNEGMKDTPEVAKVLLVDRNRRWASWVKDRMKTPGTVFLAVGAGHLAGAESVQAQLATLGVKATRVAY